MGRQIVLDIPDDALDRAERFAAIARRDVAQVIVDALANSVPPLDTVLGDVRPPL